MQEFHQKWAIVQFIQPVEEGHTFSREDWPLHVTVASNFTSDFSSDEIFEKLSSLLSQQKTFMVKAEKTDYFGPAKTIQVTVIEKNDQLLQLHSTICKFLESTGAVFDEPQYMYEGYDGHSTVQKTSQLNTGDSVNIDSLTLVDMFPDGDGLMRRALKTIKLQR